MMHRLYSANADFTKELIAISDPQEIHHAVHVLRLKSGNQICIFNGKGEEALGQIISTGSGNLSVKIASVRRVEQQRPRLILGCAIPKKMKFETIIEKATELGVAEIVPLLTQRTEIRFDSEKAAKKNTRYYTVAINAAKQCQRLTIPLIHSVTEFRKFITLSLPNSADISTATFIPCLDGQRQRLSNIFPKDHWPQRIVFLIGPEGDFTSEEVSLAVAAGAVPVSLGATTLKVDTAAISVLAFANFLLDSSFPDKE